MKTKTFNLLNISIGRIFLSWVFIMAAFAVSAETGSDTNATKQSPSLSLYHSKLGTGNHLIKATLSVRTKTAVKILFGKDTIWRGP